MFEERSMASGFAVNGSGGNTSSPSGRITEISNASDRDCRPLFERYRQSGDAAAREALVERFLPLARKLAARYRRGPEALDDLRQIASFGLLKAIDRYDPARGTAFSSFAVPTILGELRRHFRDTGWAIHVPRDLQELALRLDGTIDELHHTLGRAPTVTELAERLKTTPEQVLEAREAAAAHHAASLESPMLDGDGDGATLGDVLGAHDVALDAAETAMTAESLLRHLSDRDREILGLRFADDLTQSEIGERLGISQMHVSRLIRQSLEQLRKIADAEDEPPPLRALAA
jgi:RNA polymerase sigma-B factor